MPGNHDADWSPGLSQPARFERFTKAMAQFTIPQFNASNPVARLISLPNLAEGVSIELLLLISPTFSGIVDKVPKSMMTAVCDVFPDASGEDRARLEQALQSARGSLDIAAIGPQQRDRIRAIPQDDFPVRIALLHHHLLPHPEIEAGPFESVLDAGPVIEELLPRFDLALTGHKHTRRLLQLRRGMEFLDVYSAPSLFLGHQASPSGFTIIDVHGSNGPYYATLQYWVTGARAASQTERLIRRGRVDPQVNDICAQLSPELQRSKLLPMLEHVTKSLQWSHGHTAWPLFEDRWTQLEKDIQRLGKQVLVFRPPNLSQRWHDLLQLAQGQHGATLRLVSNEDVAFWKESLQPMTDADFYERHVRDFRGASKARVLILDEKDVGRDGTVADVEEIAERMHGYGVKVMVVWSHDVPDGTLRDFGIIGGLAVSEFRGNEVTGRSLRESFSGRKQISAEVQWETLMNLVRWKSGGGGGRAVV